MPTVQVIEGLDATGLVMDAEMLGERMAMVGLFATANKLVKSRQVQPDVYPPTASE